MTAVRASALTWETNQKPDLDRLAEMVRDLSGGAIHLAEVPNTGTDEYGLVVSTVPLADDAVQQVYDRWWVSEGPDSDRLDVIEVEQ